VIVALLTLGVFLSALAFTLLVRDMGYAFSYSDGYHSLNLAQVAATIPGRVWGFIGLVGLLCQKGLSKRESSLVIALHTALMLASALLVGLSGLARALGWEYMFLCLLPVVSLLLSRPWLEPLARRLVGDGVSLPSSIRLLRILVVGVLSWILVSLAFAISVNESEGGGAASPLLVASSFAAGYVGGFASIITPAGLGVREGIIALILGPCVGSERALALAIRFRVIHMVVLWLNAGVTTLAMLASSHRRPRDDQ
jgi:hypothetical protein